MITSIEQRIIGDFDLEKGSLMEKEFPTEKLVR